MKRLPAAFISGLLALPLPACDDGAAKVAPPPPLPTMPVPKPAADAPPAAEAPSTAAPDEKTPQPKPSKLSKREKAKQAKADAAAAKAAKAAAAAPSPAAKPSAPAPAAPAAAAPAAAATPAKGKVTIPRTAHVNIAVPAGLQADLDKDPRMQPWANQVVSVIDKCHSQNPTSAGTIEVQITMHENARPDADIKKLPGELSPIVACATGGLMRTKMPLFTGKEGTRYPVKINFTK